MNEEVPTAVALGGPMDGRELGPAEADHFDVTLADRTVHRYVRSPETMDAPGSQPYRYAGRV